MMRCSPFAYRAPTTVEEVVKILAGEGPGAVLLAGGTDLVPNMKRRQQTPATLVSLKRVGALKKIGSDGKTFVVGALRTLEEVARDRDLSRWAALRSAAAQVATPQIRNAATLGGNLCLDTRCNYYDQGYEWRKAIDFCMKKSGQICWVAPSSPRCWAVSSTDCAPALVALGAEVTLASAAGARTLALTDLYRDDGIEYLTRRADELLTDVRLPDPAGQRSTYWKLRRRDAFDFPVLGVAAALKLDGGGTVTEARIVFGAVASRPLVAIEGDRLVGQKLTDEVIDDVADAASRHAKPLDNTDFSLGWRKRVAKSFVAGALRELRGDDPAQLGLLARRQIALRPID